MRGKYYKILYHEVKDLKTRHQENLYLVLDIKSREYTVRLITLNINWQDTSHSLYMLCTSMTITKADVELR